MPQKTTQKCSRESLPGKNVFFQFVLVFLVPWAAKKAAFYAWLAGRRARLRATLHAFLRGFLDFTTFAKTEKPGKNA